MKRSIIYYVPGAQAEAGANKVLEAAGAHHAMRQGTAYNPTAKGPDGGSGQMLSTIGLPVGFKPDAQEWRKAIGADYWVGVDVNNPPGPEDLARPEMIPGHFVKMADGHDWVIPMARRYDDAAGNMGWSVALPQVRVADEQGNWSNGDVVLKYRKLWAEAERVQSIFDKVSKGDEDAYASVTIQNEMQLVVMCLATNYYVSAAEVSLLGLVSTDVIPLVGEALIDVPGLQELLSKKARASVGASS